MEFEPLPPPNTLPDPPAYQARNKEFEESLLTALREANVEKKRLEKELFLVICVFFGIILVATLILTFLWPDTTVNFEPELIRYTNGPVVQNNIQAAHVNFDASHWVRLADDLGYDWGEVFGNSMQPTFFEGNIVIEKAYDGEEIKTGQLVRFYRLTENQSCDDIQKFKERDTKTIALEIKDISLLKKNDKPVGYQLTYFKNMSSCVMLYRYKGNDFWLTAGNQFCLDGLNTIQIFNMDGISEGASYKLCRPSGGICSNLADARVYPGQTGGSWTGNEMAVIHRVAAVYDDLIIMQGDNLYEEEEIKKCQITHVVVGIMFT
jgi:signal peptidase I